MNKKKNIFWLSFAIILLLSNFWDLWYFIDTLAGKIYYKKWNYERAIDQFLSIPEHLWSYNAWNAYYKNREYEIAIQAYEWALWTENNNLLFRIYHNLWNSYYRIWEQNEENKLEYFLNSVSNYEEALEIKYDEETEANRDFVLEKIKELEEKMQENNENSEWNEDSETSSEWQDSEWQNSEWEQQSWNSQDWEKQNSNENWEEQSSYTEQTWGWNVENSKLSEEDRKALEEYTKMLQESQNAYSEWFNKVYQERSDDFFEDFFNFDPFNFDSFFDNSLLNWDNNKKDW
jgi:hypothetical protein